MTISRRAALLGALGGMGLVTAGCGGGNGGGAASPAAVATGSVDALVAAAKEEGSLRLYTALTQPDMDALVKGFQDKYDIRVEAMRLGGADGMNRFDAESKSGARTADVAVFADPAYFGKAAKAGHTVPIEETGVLPLVPDFPEKYVLPEYQTAVLQIAIAGWSYNPDKVAEADLPTSWEDLLDPKWKGRLGVTPGATNLNSMLTWQMVEKEVGEDYLDKLRPQIKRVYPNLIPLQEAVGAGEVDIALSALEQVVLAMQERGTKIAFTRMSPTYYPTITWGVSSRAASPNAARLLAVYMMSEDGTKTINPKGAVSPYDTANIPEDFHVATAEDVAAAESKRAKYANLK